VDFSTAFFIVDKTGPDTLSLELALVQIVPSKADLNVVENVVGFVIRPLGFLTVFNSGAAAFEGKLKTDFPLKIIVF
jgi:hypothetical protein